MIFRRLIPYLAELIRLNYFSHLIKLNPFKISRLRIAINYWNTQWGGEKHRFFIDRQSSPEICIQLNEDGRKTYQIKNIFINF